jgi:hypothetical protein
MMMWKRPSPAAKKVAILADSTNYGQLGPVPGAG